MHRNYKNVPHDLTCSTLYYVYTVFTYLRCQVYYQCKACWMHVFAQWHSNTPYGISELVKYVTKGLKRLALTNISILRIVVHCLAVSGRNTSDNRINILLIALIKGNLFGFCCKFVLNMFLLWIQHFNQVLNRNFAFRPHSDSLTTYNVICFTGKCETQILLGYNMVITALLNNNIIL